MTRNLTCILLFLLGLSACTKVEKTRTSGIDTIESTVYYSTTYYSFGFRFSTAKLVPTYPLPGPDITIYVNTDNVPSRLILQANNLNPSFHKVGDYAGEAEAKDAFNNLKTVDATQWADFADPLLANQVWIYKTGADSYAKIRIISTVNEVRQGIAYGECTFEWVFQPDGSSTFPGK